MLSSLVLLGLRRYGLGLGQFRMIWIPVETLIMPLHKASTLKPPNPPDGANQARPEFGLFLTVASFCYGRVWEHLLLSAWMTKCTLLRSMPRASRSRLRQLPTSSTHVLLSFLTHGSDTDIAMKCPWQRAAWAAPTSRMPSPS